MRWVWWVVWGVVAAAIVAWLAWGRISIFHSTDEKEMYAAQTLPLVDGAVVSQTFVADYPGLDRIDLYFQNRGVGAGAVQMHLKADSCDNPADLVEFALPETSIADNAFYPVQFPPLDDSAGRRYCVVLEPRGLAEENELAVFASKTDVYPAGQADYRPPPAKSAPEGAVESPPVQASPAFSATHFIWLPMIFANPVENKAIGRPDIGFLLYYSGPVPGTLLALLAHISAFKPFVLGSPWFYAVLGGVYLVMLAIFARAIWTTGRISE